ncbi:MAG: 50S ribosome-binding GTPase, partial [Alphaproteobacteria bacterium]|nr:50S ribosome-binding GTPase [Alphaproteobacteria bacterium]
EEEEEEDSDDWFEPEAELAMEAVDKTPRNSAEKPLQLAIIGRPNVGKSTLVNRLIGEERLLTGPEAGLTRDSIAVALNFENNFMRIIDTAGLRRQASVSTKLEKLAVADSLRAVRFAEVVVLVIDATVGFDKQDLTIAGLVAEEGRAMVVAINKWDAISGEDRPVVLQAIRDRLTESLGQVRGIPLETISAKTGARLDAMLRSVVAQERLWSKRATTADINRWLAAATAQHPPPLIMGRPLRLRYGTQIKSRPPTLAIFTSRPAELPDSYCRYLIGSFRDHFGLPGVPIRLVLRKSSKNPFSGGAS